MIAAYGKELPLVRCILKIIEHPLWFAIGKYRVKQCRTPGRDSLSDAASSLVVNLGRVLNGVDLEIPLQVSLRFGIKRGGEHLASRRLYLAAVI